VARFVSDAARVVRAWLGPWQPQVALVLGSGLGFLADRLERARRLGYDQIPGFALPTVAGHRGQLVAGALGDRRVLCQSGRFHGYEGHSAETVVLPVRLFADLGIDTLLLTNAAGGIHPSFRPGTLMLLADHINLTFRNGLQGPPRPGDGRFPDMSAAYDPVLRALAREVARAEGIALAEGVYAGVPGPSYETAAEIRMLRRLGADAVGMSTVLEVTAARAEGLRCLAISTITNLATGLGRNQPLTHDEVVATAAEAGRQLGRLVAGIIVRSR
jgi:purine-nucleoside phosphorylase